MTVNERNGGAMQDARTRKMPNGATIADWLGTAATAAKVAGMYLNDVRNGVAGSGKLDEADAQLAQAREEIAAIRSRLATV